MKKSKILAIASIVTMLTLFLTVTPLAATSSGTFAGANYIFSCGLTTASSSVSAPTAFTGGTSVSLTTLWCTPSNVTDTKTSSNSNYNSTMATASSSSCSTSTTAPDATHTRAAASDSSHYAGVNGYSQTAALHNQ
ncbi:hypothetical protein [Clostridium sp. KNHs205]|jgi:hypothetical protein|uniref:hypothetical protein n=1 Tax=Clostridium sp. KNHs205 TaxID=1449050 RepID=UPI0012DF3181|nr:hypothetical protein [Clostridium sp. KNHs205]